ncbi:MAG TPA: aminotransferase class V-fold PLP-dependent enzyme, partial [Thermoanaerobaculia bacterium]
MIYLDNNASTPLDPEVREAMAAALDLYGNPSSVHSDGRRARRAIEEAREEVARLVGARIDEIFFTSGGT